MVVAIWVWERGLLESCSGFKIWKFTRGSGALLFLAEPLEVGVVEEYQERVR
jgi:hypothetical protein